MDIAELVLKYLQALAWPLVVGAVLLLLRGEIRALAGRVTGAELPGVRLQFENEALKARLDAEKSKDAVDAKSFSPVNESEVEEQSKAVAPPTDRSPAQIGIGAVLIANEWQSVQQEWLDFANEALQFSKAYLDPNHTLRLPEVGRRIGLPEEWGASVDRISRLVFTSESAQASPNVQRELRSTITELKRQFRRAAQRHVRMRQMHEQMQQRSSSTE